MKVAILLPGFVRDLSYLNALNVFLNNHKSYNFDLYTSSYDIVGLPTKSSINHEKYKTTESFIGHEYISKFKRYELDNYESYSKECLQFVNKNELSFFIQKCSNEFWKKYNAKFKIKETEETLLANIFAQWNKVYRTYCLLDDPDSYDVIIRSRYDYNLKTMDLNKYVNFCNQDKKTVVHKTRSLINQPKVILADEPTSALDDESCNDVISLLKELSMENNAVLIIVTHDRRLKKKFTQFIDLDVI